MSDNKADVELSHEAIEHFIHMTAAYMQALDGLAPTETAVMKALVFMIPTDPRGPHDGNDIQMAKLQMMTNLEKGQVKRVLKDIIEAIDKAEAKAGGMKMTERVMFVGDSGGRAN